jgi:uncharacterized protein (TIGR03437 family)
MNWLKCTILSLLVALPCIWCGAAAAQTPGDPQSRIVVFGNDAGRLSSPASSETLSVQVTSAGGTPQANVSVQFVGPASGPGGGFPGSGGENEQVASAQTDSSGVAQVQFLTNDIAGPMTIVASLEDGEGATNLAITSTGEEVETEMSAQEARGAVISEFLSTGTEGVDYRLNGPYWIPAGTQVAAAGPDSVADAGQPVISPKDRWLFWVDDQPGARYAHPVRYILIDTDDAGDDLAETATLVFTEWWPNVILPGQRQTISLLGPVAVTADSPEEVVSKLDRFLRRYAAEDACAVLVYGVDVPGGKKDTENMRDFLVNSGRVNADNVLLNMHDFGGTQFNRVASRADIQRLLVRAAENGCKKLYLLISAHGSQYEGGGVGLLPSPNADPSVGSETLKYEDLTTMLVGLGDVEICGVISACFSGNARRWFNGRGLKGQLITDADTSHSSYGSNRFGGTYLWYFLRAFDQPAADADGNGETTFDEAHDYAVGNNNVANLNGPNPQSNTIAPGGNKHMDVEEVTIYSERSPDRVEFTRPRSSNFDSPFTITVQVENPGVAAPASTTIVIPPITGGDPTQLKEPNSVKVNFTGLDCGTTRYTVTGTDNSGMTWEGSGSVTVGSFTLSQKEINVDVSNGPVQVPIVVTRFSDPSRATRFSIWSRDMQVADVAPHRLPMVAFQPADVFVVTVSGAGTTEIDIEDRGTYRRKTIKVNATAGPSGPSSACPESGSADTTFTIPSGGNPGLHPFSLRRATVWFDTPRAGFRQLWSNHPEIVQAEVAIDNNCNFEGTGNSGPISVLGFRNVEVRYFEGKFATPSLGMEFKYEVGTNGAFPGGQSTLFDAEGEYESDSGPGGEPSHPTTLDFGPDGGSGHFMVPASVGQSWMGITEAPWISFLNNQGIGPGTMEFLVLMNGDTQPRTTTIAAAGETFTVNQEGAPNPFAPMLTSAVNGANFQEGYASKTWTTLTGENLAAEPKSWFTESVGRRRKMEAASLPTELAGVSVKINGKPAAIAYVSPTQINLLWPEDETEGDVEVELASSRGVSNRIVVNKRRLSPSLFRYSPDGLKYAAALHPDNLLVGLSGFIPGAASRPAMPGRIIVLYGTGFGPTNPPTPADKLVSSPAPLVSPAVARIGGVNAPVLFGGVVAAGLYQFNIEVPILEDGDHLVELFVEGIGLEDTVYVTVRN